MPKLYSYFRSSAAYRVRIALALKGLPYETVPVHLLRDGGEQHGAAYRAANPQALVPALQTEDGGPLLTQSLAIIEYLDEAHGGPPLLPAAPLARARVRALAQAVACDLHPLNNLRVLRYLKRDLGVSDEQKNAWYAHWVALGLGAVEQMLAGSPDTGRFCHGEAPGLADCCLVPQIYNAQRFGCPLDAYPTIGRIVAACNALPAFQQAAPERQPDAA
ncbi:maleylacetoacetate isomerase [Oryzisolibacter propanilivorax]|uniref:Maleylacetoacetate isomerase n=1 Tax=Oryzisolibacter propanilivorax TaxID=1527607 RepID=A0A1G9T2R6_9BURK|nr:maleylacetoacetate isomerase [Oryzisolibacter propanilivorax]SDM41375.1 maleylacetoacetate isomerase [Oryzisolibacter propanilivorax]